MRIDIWSDVVCPFCYIGKRHLEQALADFPHRDQFEVVWHSFELDPSVERTPSGTLAAKIAEKYGMSLAESEQMQQGVAERAAAVGLEFNWREAKYGNTFDAHRLLHLAAARGRSEVAHERLLRGYFTEGVQIGDPAELLRLAVEIGLDEAEARQVLESDEYADAVRADQAQARSLGITGVPFFVLDGRLGVSGAQPTELFRQALDRAWAESSPLQVISEGGPGCSGDNCAI